MQWIASLTLFFLLVCVFFRDRMVAWWRRRTLVDGFVIQLDTRVQEYQGILRAAPAHILAWLGDDIAKTAMLSSIVEDVRAWTTRYYPSITVVTNGMPYDLRAQVDVVLWSEQTELVTRYYLPHTNEQVTANAINGYPTPLGTNVQLSRRTRVALCREIIATLVSRIKRHPKK